MSHSSEVNYQVHVPFSWEHKPGVSKTKHHHHHQERTVVDVRQINSTLKKLPPPPSCPSKGSTSYKVSLHHLDLPFRLPALKAPYRSSFKLLLTIKKCTASNDHDKIKRKGINAAQILSSKYSCAVASDNLPRMSQIPKSMMKEREIERLKSGNPMVLQPDYNQRSDHCHDFENQTSTL